ncbi:MAG: ABC transporter ATP-binding protein [Cyclobacteriaceae bacterium]
MIEVELDKRLLGSEGSFDLRVSFSIPTRSVFAIMGPSGVGKTTILKMLAGLIAPDNGSIVVEGKIWYDSRKRINLLPQKRSTGYVFQNYALFPNMNVRQNLEYALQHKGQQALVEEVLALTGLEQLQHQKPGSLSGGQQQRVALARAIVRQPQVLLLDEPFAALDRPMRLKLQQDLISLHERYGTTTILVSHDTYEVARMADEVAQVEKGSFVRQGKPAEILPVRQDGMLRGKVIEVDEDRGVFILIEEEASGLWSFPVPVGFKIYAGQRVELSVTSGNVRSIE